ncbi:DUF2075 domain-containing protein [Gluconobacter cerinus]|uniref:DUF2075 domain-containing protein n=1 Tax=Gluconobacter cerinus TaxID=38307 RepID=UPI001B8CE0DD|nr:DUF2075 domain-containing protein [Gluconobacter cerinus]MBS1030072.1 DUF2075 domain-containing protein [Gluconobacter cerinus]
MGAWWSGPVATFLNTDLDRIGERLAHEAGRRRFSSEPQQLRAWATQLDLLRTTLTALPQTAGWQILFEFPIPRLGGRIDTVLISPDATFVLEFKVGASQFDAAALAQTEGYALDLQDFHAGSRHHPIIPILIATEAAQPAQTSPLLLGSGVTSVLKCNSANLIALLSDLARRTLHSVAPMRPEDWEQAPYNPVPSIVEAARLIYSTHSVADIHTARADATNLTLTSDRITELLETARGQHRKTVIFVSGIPGAGKTLCGLKAAFGTTEPDNSATFLTGNPTLVHVLREALTRDAVAQGQKRAAVEQRMESTIQSLTKFRDYYVGRPVECPPERIMVIDEAQRSWNADQAIRKSAQRPVRLTQSEPAHLLDIMHRHAGFAAIICLIGQGQEIHDGEGGLACWGDALASRPEWQIHASPDVVSSTSALTTLPPSLPVQKEPSLHLTVPVRSLRDTATPQWVNAVLEGNVSLARNIAENASLPFRLTRSLPELRKALRERARLTYRCGLIASSQAKRLRAEGLGAELAHMDSNAVAQWFLNRWVPDKDVRASDALETVATQFAIQGLELDFVGLCWDGDLIRTGYPQRWQPRRFSGTTWQTVKSSEKALWSLNTYRVLLTRARYETIIWVPEGNPDDPTRCPETLNGIADFLLACGIEPLKGAETLQTVGRCLLDV